MIGITGVFIVFSYNVIFGDQMICTIEFFISFVVDVVVIVLL